MAAPTIDALPASPSRNDPSTFSNKADALVAALPGLVTDINAVGTYYNSNALVEYAFGAGTVAAPSIHFQGTTDTGLYLSGGYITFSHDGVASAFIEADGTTVSSANAIITSEKGDARYLKLAGSTMTGDINLSNNDLLNVTRLELKAGSVATPSLYWATDTDTGLYFSGTRTCFSNDGVEAAVVDPAGTSISDAQSVITREKGDARYLPLSGGTMSGQINMGNSAITNINELQVSDGSATDPSFTFGTETATGIFLLQDFTSFTHDGSVAALISAGGTAAGDAKTLMTREKGDTRYAFRTFSAGAVGTYGLFRKTSTGSRTAGQTLAGSNLRYAGVSGGGTAEGATPAGSWRCMGHLGTSTTLVTVFIRYA